MKNLIALMTLILVWACNTQPVETFESFGATIEADSPSTLAELTRLLETEDSVEIKLEGEIEEICQMKGCWMILKSEEESDPVRVTFKDYGFFVPKDAQERKTIIEGVATKTVLSPETAKHYAEDAGVPYDSTKTYTEISFVANGVLIASAEVPDNQE